MRSWAAFVAARRRVNIALAKVAVARKLATRLYLMLREDWTYAQLCRAMGRRARIILWSKARTHWWYLNYRYIQEKKSI